MLRPSHAALTEWSVFLIGCETFFILGSVLSLFPGSMAMIMRRHAAEAPRELPRVWAHRTRPGLMGRGPTMIGTSKTFLLAHSRGHVERRQQRSLPEVQRGCSNHYAITLTSDVSPEWSRWCRSDPIPRRPEQPGHRQEKQRGNRRRPVHLPVENNHVIFPRVEHTPGQTIPIEAFLRPPPKVRPASGSPPPTS